MQSPELTLIIVSWNAKQYLQNCLESLRESLDAGFCNVVVVDNNSKDGSAEFAEIYHPAVNVIRSSTNLGFARANNLALAGITTPFGMFLNSDTVVSRSALEKLLAIMKSRPEFWICGCQHFDASGSIQNPFGRFPSLKSEFITMTGMFNWPIIRHLIEFRKRRRIGKTSSLATDDEPMDSVEQVVPVDYVSGASMIFRREQIAQLGGFDESYFFYSEDADICKRVWRRGGRVGFCPGISIIHYGGGSYGPHYLSVLREWMYSRVLFFGKHYGKARQAALIGVYFAAGLLSLMKWFGIFIVSPRRRAEALEWFRFWLTVLRGDRKDLVEHD
jgi:GT2 family glycosyltransferase